MTVTRRYYANAAPQRTLASGITSSATSCAISGTFTGWPTQFPFFAALEYGTANVEIVSVTNIVGTTATIARGQGGTVAISHNAGSTMDQVAVAQDFDEANAHAVATSGVHGVASTIVGTTDAQTLTNKTLTSPTINTPTVTGGTYSDVLHTGDNSNAALKGKAASGGRALETQDSTGTTKLTVDGDTGNVSTPGSVTSGAQTVNGNETVNGNQTVTGTANVTGTATVGNLSTAGTVSASGAATAASFTASGNGVAAGVIQPKSYTNQAAATTALPSPQTGALVYLTAPTGGPDAGVFVWNGSAWKRHAPLIQTGTGSITLHAGNLSETLPVTFPTTFNGTPVVLLQSNGIEDFILEVNSPGASGYTIRVWSASGTTPGIDHSVAYTWIAFGQQ